MDQDKEKHLGYESKSHMERSIEGMEELIMEFRKIEAYLKKQKKSIRLLLTVITIAVAGLLCYRLGENIGEFLYHINL